MIKSLKRYYGVSAANTAKSVSTDIGKRAIVRSISVNYSAAPTEAGITVNLDSGLGAGYDTILYTGAANTRYNNLPLDYNPYVIMEDDVLTVTAPAGGGALTSTISIIVEEL